MWPFDRKKTKQGIADKVAASARTEEQEKARKLAMRRAVMKSMERRANDAAIKWAPPQLMPGVVPAGTTPAVAMDSLCGPTYQFLNSAAGGLYAANIQPFPGYQNLAALATRPEYRAFASTLSTELTREGIEITSKDRTKAKEMAEKIKELEEACEYYGVMGIIQKAAEHDCFFGRGQISINIKGADVSVPLILDPRTIKKGSLTGFSNIEPMWTSPSAYNALDPTAPDFYKPSAWWVLGREMHTSRLLTIITRPLPDMLKPAYNFSGISMSQLAQPYVENWLRTRQSVSDLVDKFSRTFLKTNMAQVLNGGEGGDVFDRVEMYINMQSNLGLAVMDNETEDIVQVNTPLSGLADLQSQSQEHMCSVSKIPAIKLTGISPSGLNASSEGEIRSFYDDISSVQQSYYFSPLDTMLKVIQLSKWGEIDDAITFKFKSLWQTSAKEESEIRFNKAQEAQIYITNSVIDPSEARQQLSDDPDSGWNNIDGDLEIVQPGVFDDEGGDLDVPVEQNKGSLNGAQVSSLVEISQSVAAGTLSVEAAEAVLLHSFGIGKGEADKMLSPPENVPSVEVAESAKVDEPGTDVLPGEGGQ